MTRRRDENLFNGSGVPTYSGTSPGSMMMKRRLPPNFWDTDSLRFGVARVKKSFAEHDAKRHRQEDAEMLIPK
jgi:hypothetical protein